MPCYDPRDAVSLGADKDEIDELTRMLCAACQHLERNRLRIPPLVERWWFNHKKADQQRREMELAEQRRREALIEAGENILDDLGDDADTLLQFLDVKYGVRIHE